MPKIKTNQSGIKSEIKRLMSRNEFIIGAGTIIVILVGLILSAKYLNQQLSQNVKIPTTIPQASPSPTQNMKPNNLSTTSSFIHVVVGTNDSYYTITTKYCGSGKFYKFVADINGNTPLYEGGNIKVSCSF